MSPAVAATPRRSRIIARAVFWIVAVALCASFVHMSIYAATDGRHAAPPAPHAAMAAPPSTLAAAAAASRGAVRGTDRVSGRAVAARSPGERPSRRRSTRDSAKAIGTIAPFAFDAPDFIPQQRTKRRPRLPASATNRSWAPDLYNCVFVTVVTTRARLSHYALLIESALRLGDAFKLARRYPHVLLHEDALPADHRAHVAAHIPRAVFRALGPAFRDPAWAPRESEWLATDRDAGYRRMCRFYGLQIARAMRDLGVDAFMRVDDDVLFLGAVAFDPFQFLYESGAVYAYGTDVPEEHEATRESLGPWLYEFCAGIDWGWTRRDCATLRDETFEKMFFTNVFASRTAFWLVPQVDHCAETKPTQETFNLSVSEQVFRNLLLDRRELGERGRTVQ